MTERPFRPHPKPGPRASAAARTPLLARPLRMTHESANGVAIDALAWLAADAERLDRFLALTGIGHDTIREAATQPGFLSAVLDHLCADEASLLAFAGEIGKPPETIALARDMLSGPSPWSSI
jgi:uncharacterized protein YbjT (DUF2867 family)